MLKRAIVGVGLSLLLGGCIMDRGPSFGARELVPPQRGIYVGSIYYAAEAPTKRRDIPTALEPLCDTRPDLSAFGVANPKADPVADINLLFDARLQGELGGVSTKLVSLGLSGNVSDYYEYKLTHVSKYAISEAAAQTVFEGMMRDRRCRAAVDRNRAFGIYQVQATYVGDIVFRRKQAAASDASVSARLSKIEPTIKSTFSRTLDLGFSGEGLVFSFVPILRSPSGS